MKSPRRQQYFGIATGLFLVLLGAWGTVNLAWSDNLADRTVFKRSTVTGSIPPTTTLAPDTESPVQRRPSVNSPPAIPNSTQAQDRNIGLSELSGLPSSIHQRKSVLITATPTQSVLQPANRPANKFANQFANQFASTAPRAKLPEPDGFKPRLPTYYSRLVTPPQRERIYWIQKRYYVEIEKHRARIKKLEDERDKLIQSCLTASQIKQLMQWKGGR